MSQESLWDGDQLTAMPLIDKFMYESAKMLEPAHYVASLNKCFEVSGFCRNTAEAKSTIRHWMESEY